MNPPPAKTPADDVDADRPTDGDQHAMTASASDGEADGCPTRPPPVPGPGRPVVGEPPVLRPELAPGWLGPLLRRIPGIGPDELMPHGIPTPPDARRAAVLIAFAEHPAHGPDVLLVERASTLRAHAGQVAFPGGGVDPGDADEVAAALREAEEETGLAPDGVVPVATLPRLFLPPSAFLVTPVIAHWARPVAVHAVDPAETAAVVRVPLAELADPRNRIRIRHSSGLVGNAFLVADLVVWGFTGGLLSALLDLGGWARPWDPSRVLELEAAWSAARSGRQEVMES